MAERQDAAARRGVPAGSVAIIAAGLVPAAAAVVAAVAGGVDLSPVVRLLVTVVVYGPVSALALSFRRPGISLIAGSLAVTSGWFALLLILARSDVHAVEAWVLPVAHVARLPEVAALSIIPWLLARDAAHPRRLGVVFGSGAVVLTAGASLAALVVPVPAWIDIAPLIWAVVSLVAGAVVLVRRSRDTGARHRDAVWSFMSGIVLLAASYARVVVPLPPAGATLADAIFVLAQALLPVGILAAIVPSGSRPARVRTVDAIAWAQALAFGASAYLAASALTGLLGVDPLVAGAVCAATLALVLGASARVTRARLGRLFAERPLDAREVLARLGEQVTADDDGVRSLAEALRETWTLASVEIHLDSSADAVQVGVPAASVLGATLVSGGRRIGSITLTAEDADDLERVIRPVLSQTAGLIAVAVHLASVNEEVAATRRRTLDLRREERRRLHAELHDEVAPALAGIGFGMAGADVLLEREDSAARAALGRLRDEVSATTETVRALARALLPTALDQGDLAGALAELADAAAADGASVRVTAEGSDVLSGDRQLALYLLVAEAVRISRRTASATRLDVAVLVQPDVVRLRIHVDGDPDSTRDVWAAVAHRTRELGGRVEGGDAVIPR